MTRDFLFELGCEELPPKALTALSESLAQGVGEGLRAAGISFERIEPFATPRRLALLGSSVLDHAPERHVERRGPPVSQAFDGKGAPTQAAISFARTCGVDLAQLTRVKTGKGEWLAFSGTEAGASTRDVLPQIIARTLDALPIPRRMRWGSRDTEFVRPVHWVVLLWGPDVLDVQILGMQAGRETRGHRFHAPQSRAIDTPAQYEALLHGLHVVASVAKRREIIRQSVASEAARILIDARPSQAVIEEPLLDEVTALVEWPVPFVGNFDAKFLQLPREVVVSTVQHHQRYFPVETADGQLTHQFIAIANIESREPEKVRAGNERVVRPRLEDASFFWSQDRKHSLAERAAQLGRVTFQTKLGSYADKTRRIETLARRIADALGGSAWVMQAAALAKADLLTEMVGEFPELQGTIGRYYALQEHLPAEVATALQEQYLPRFAADTLPVTTAGRALALADRLDTLAGIFSIDLKPTGAKDPFALRRAALGVLRILLDAKLDLDLRELLDLACGLQPVQRPAAVAETLQFLLDRLRGLYLEVGHGFSGEMLDAVLAVGSRAPVDIDARLKALRSFLQSSHGADLTAAFKRISNILRKTQLDATVRVDPTHLVLPAERALHDALEQIRVPFNQALAVRDYAEAMRLLTGLRSSTDEFFDSVMVMDEDLKLRTNRLALLREVQALFLVIADLSQLPG